MYLMTEFEKKVHVNILTMYLGLSGLYKPVKDA